MSLLFLNTCLARKPDHEKLEKDLKTFLSQGGEIQVLPSFGSPVKEAEEIFRKSNSSFFPPREFSVKIWKL